MKSFLERNSSSASFYDCTKELRTPLIFFFFSLFFFLHEVEALLKKNKKKTSWQELALSTYKCE